MVLGETLFSLGEGVCVLSKSHGGPWRRGLYEVGMEKVDSGRELSPAMKELPPDV